MLQYQRPTDILNKQPQMFSHQLAYLNTNTLRHYQHDPRPNTGGSTASSQWDHSDHQLVSPIGSSFSPDSPTSPLFAHHLPIETPASLVLPAPSDSQDAIDDAAKTYSFVSLPGNTVKKRPRRRYDEIERLYSCNWPGCTKAYGTLNHLNAHINMQRHGPKRTPAEFKELRKQWRKAKKEEAERAARMNAPQAAHQSSHAGLSPTHDQPGSMHPHAHPHSLVQHASLPDLHHPHHTISSAAAFSHPAPPPPSAYAQQHQQHRQPLYHPSALAMSAVQGGSPHDRFASMSVQFPSASAAAAAAQDAYNAVQMRRHSYAYTPAQSAPQQQSASGATLHHAGSHPQLYPAHSLSHSLSNASLGSSASHLSLSPPLEYAEATSAPATSYQNGATAPSGWLSRAETQGWDTQPPYAYEPAAATGQSYAEQHQQPRASPASYDNVQRGQQQGTLPPDSTLLTPLSVPGYVPPSNEDA